MYCFPSLQPVHCSMTGSNRCLLFCIQISQEAGKVVWYSHLFQNFPRFVVIHTGFGIINKAEIDVFLELSRFFDDPADVGNWSLVPLPFLKPAWTSGSSRFTYCWKMMLWKCCTQYASKFGKHSCGHRTGKVSFHSNPKERQCQRMLKLLHNCTHLTH